jgi:hypothetical protein
VIDVLDVTSVEPGVGYVYRWVNLVNGRMYIGSHDGSNPRYRASGVLIRQAFEKYGDQSFRREYLYVGPDYRIEEEKFLLLVDASTNPEYYNLKNTAVGWDSGQGNPMYGKSGPEHPKFGVPCSEENRKKLSDERKGDPKFGRRGEKNHNYGKRMPEEVKEKLRQWCYVEIPFQQL